MSVNIAALAARTDKMTMTSDAKDGANKKHATMHKRPTMQPPVNATIRRRSPAAA